MIHRGYNDLRRRVAATAAALLIWAPAAADDRRVPLSEVLESLRAQGFPIVYSDEIVRPELEVDAPAGGPWNLDQARGALAGHGLELRQLEGGVYLVVRGPLRKGAIRGRVLSALSDRPVAAAELTIRGPVDKVVHSQADGRFEAAELAAGSYQLIVESASFQTQRLAVQVPVQGRAETELTVRLELKPELLVEIVVTPDRYDITAEGWEDRSRISRAELQDTPLRVGETLAMAETIPGVAIGSEQAPPRIRGSGDRDVLVVMDGLELYEPYHLPDFRSPFSLVDPEAVDTLEIHTGGMSAQFGDRIGGLVRIETPSSIPSEPRAFSLGSASARASWSGALPRDGFWAASARLWYPNAGWNTVEVGDDEIDPRLGDLFGKLQFRAGSNGTLSLHLLGSSDEVDFTAAENDETVQASVTSRYAWGRWSTVWSPATTSETVLGVGRVDRARDGRATGAVGETSLVRDDRALGFFAVSQRWSHRIGARHLLGAGFDLRRLRADYDYASTVFDELDPRAVEFDLEPSGTSVAAYFSDRLRLGERAVLELGARWDAQGHTDDSQVSPRLNLAWRLGDRGVFRISAGRYAQSQRIHELEIEDAVTKFAPAQISDQVSAAWEGELGSGWRCRIGGYERRLRRLRPRFENLFDPIELFPEVERDRIRIDAGRARARGLELSLESPSAHGWILGRLAYTLSRADDREPGRWVPRSWDQRHAASASISLRLGSASRLALAAYARSGWPTTPVPDNPEQLLDPGAELLAFRNSARFPSYFRLDARYSFTRAVRQSSLRFDLAVSNLTDRNNVCCVDVAIDPETGELIADQEFWTDIAPVLSAAWRF